MELAELISKTETSIASLEQWLRNAPAGGLSDGIKEEHEYTVAILASLRSLQAARDGGMVSVPVERLERWQVMMESAYQAGVQNLYDSGGLTPNGKMHKEESEFIKGIL